MGVARNSLSTSTSDHEQHQSGPKAKPLSTQTAKANGLVQYQTATSTLLAKR